METTTTTTTSVEESTELVKYDNNSMYEIWYYDDWQVSEDYANFQTAFTPPSATYPVFWVKIYDAGGLTLDQYANAAVDNSFASLNGFTLIGLQPTDVNGEEAGYIMTYTYNDAYMGQVQGFEVMLSDGVNAFHLAYVTNSEDYPDNAIEAVAMIDNFELQQCLPGDELCVDVGDAGSTCSVDTFCIEEIRTLVSVVRATFPEMIPDLGVSLIMLDNQSMTDLMANLTATDLEKLLLNVTPEQLNEIVTLIAPNVFDSVLQRIPEGAIKQEILNRVSASR